MWGLLYSYYLYTIALIFTILFSSSIIYSSPSVILLLIPFNVFFQLLHYLSLFFNSLGLC